MQSLKSEIGVALLGVSHPHASGRLRAIRNIQGTRIVGAADDDPVIEPFARYLEVPIRSVDELLKDPTVRLVLVHSKSRSMVSLASAALRAGKAVLVEKPGGNSLSELEALVKVVEETKGICQVGYTYRFSSAVAITDELLQTGALGHVTQVRLHGGCSLNEAATSHLNQPDDIGGAYFVIGCHILDLLVHHFGMPSLVNAKVPKFENLFGQGSREDAAIAIFEYPDKLISFDFTSWDPLPWVETWDLSCYGTEGVLHARSLPATCRFFLQEEKGRFQKGWTSWFETSFPVAWASKKTEYTPELAEIGNLDLFSREVESFVAAAFGEQQVQIPASHARDILKLIVASYESSSHGGREVIVA